MDYQLIFAVGFGVCLLLFLILKLKIQAFISLLMASIAVGLLAGMSPLSVIDSVQSGMGNTLGFVATVVGLGAIFGSILEHSGGAKSIANFLINKFGEKNAPWSMSIAGFIIAIPVFFDVGFIILIPIIYSLQRKTKQSMIIYALPLLAGLAATHSFIPPTPGPVAVADIIGANLGWVIFFGALIGIPAVIISGPVFANYIKESIFVEAPPLEENAGNDDQETPPFGLIIAIVSLPIFLIVLNTVSKVWVEDPEIIAWTQFFGHPFTALILANLLAWYFLGIKRGYSLNALTEITGKSLAPAGIIILLTGAGGVFKQILVDTGAGTMLAESFSQNLSSPFIFAFVAAALTRVVQGSATVAMITSAGMTAAIIQGSDMKDTHLALLVIAIASGATVLSHVNDSGFWLVSKYLNLSEKQTFRSWTVMTTLLGVTSFLLVLLLALFV